MAEREPIGVIGTGYVGLVTAAGFAELGSEVWCIDIDAEKIENLKQGVIPIWEPGLEEMVARHRDRMHFSTDLTDALEHARLLFVAVGTPPLYSGDADLSAAHAVGDSMPASDHPPPVMKSTVPVGTGGHIKRKFAESGKEGFRYVSCPEFLKEGSALADFLEPDRVVIGDDGDWAGDAVAELYSPLDAPLVRTDIPSAEMVKLAANAFLATKLSFINEIANVCEVTGADVTEVARGIGLDDRIGPKFLQAGIGFGGSCLMGEETVLARRAGRTSITRLDDLYERYDADEQLEVMAWRPGMATPEFMPVMGVSRRPADEVIEVRTKMGRRVVCTPDHPFVVSPSGEGGDEEIKLARDLTESDWLPLAIGAGQTPTEQDEILLHALAGLELAGLTESDVIVRPAAQHLANVFAERASVLQHPRGANQRSFDIRRSGALRLDEAWKMEIPLDGATVATAKNGTHIPLDLETNEAFWRVVGLYLAEGHITRDGDRQRLQWSFHPTREEHLVDEVAGFWRARGVKADVRRTGTTASVVVSSRLLGSWWTQSLGLSRNSYVQRLPDLIWDISE